LPPCPVLASTATQYVVDGHDTDTRPLPGSMLLAADHAPPAPDGLELDGLDVGELVDGLEVGELVDGLEVGELVDGLEVGELVEQALATTPAMMQVTMAAASRGPRVLVGATVVSVIGFLPTQG
jgi:hypothetical protein